MTTPPTDQELKRGSAALLVLALVADTPRHGYEIARTIETRSNGAIRFNIASLYPLLYRLERRGWVEGAWKQPAGTRRRRYYRITPAGRKVLAGQRKLWRTFIGALDRIAGLERA